MDKLTLREIKRLISTGAARDITRYSFDEMRDFISSHSLDKIGYSAGTYGINGGVVQDNDTGELYAVAARNSALLMLF